MAKKYFFLMLAATLLSVSLLSIVWEFFIEDAVMTFINKSYRPEALHERWEYVITVTFFTFLAMILPAVIGYRLNIREERHHEEIKQISEQDYLTKLYNRRKLCQVIDSEINRCTRYHHRFCMVMLDVDHFKKTNDMLGHDAGDQLLIEIAESIKKMTRGPDIAGRWGGEEFLILCPETNIDGASKLAENLRSHIESKEIPSIGHMTASLGVVAYSQGETLQEVVSRADHAMYSAKKSGRNKVVVHE
jgi:diguanylate cyclase (GGDEF)-like protein